MATNKVMKKGVSHIVNESFFDEKKFLKRKAELEKMGYKLSTGKMPKGHSKFMWYIVYNTIWKKI